MHAVVADAGKVFYYSYYSSRHYDNRPRKVGFRLLAALGALLTECVGGALGVLIYPTQEVLAAHESHIAVNIFHLVLLLLAALVIGMLKAFWLALFRPAKVSVLKYNLITKFIYSRPGKAELASPLHTHSTETGHLPFLQVLACVRCMRPGFC